MMALRRRKATPAELRREQLRQARVDAPTLQQLLPTAAQVRVELTFDADVRLADAPCQFTIYPPAQAHFVYACPFGDCNGTYDLNPAFLDMLNTGMCRATGALHCNGRRAHRGGPGPRCGLGVTYSLVVRYAAEQLRPMAQPALAP